MSLADLLQDMIRRAGKEVFNNELLSDAKVTVADTTWPVHKSILCPRSEYFKKAFTGPFNKATTNQLTIKGHTIPAVKYVLHYLYTGESKFYPLQIEIFGDRIANRKSTVLADRSEILTIRDAVDAFVAADYFDLEPLKGWSLTLFECHLESMQYSNSDGPFLDDDELGYVFHAARLAYTSGPNLEALREPIQCSMVDTHFLLSRDKRFMQESKKIPEFSMALIEAMSSPQNEKRMLACCRALPERCTQCDYDKDEFAETTLYTRPSHDPDNPRVLV